jgi:hypothetical protein
MVTCEGVPERSACGVKQICGSKTNAASTSAVNESGDFQGAVRNSVWRNMKISFKRRDQSLPTINLAIVYLS